MTRSGVRRSRAQAERCCLAPSEYILISEEGVPGRRSGSGSHSEPRVCGSQILSAHGPNRWTTKGPENNPTKHSTARHSTTRHATGIQTTFQLPTVALSLLLLLLLSGNAHYCDYQQCTRSLLSIARMFIISFKHFLQ